MPDPGGIGRKPVIDVKAVFTLPASTPAGTLSITANYPGAEPSAAVAVTVAKATSQAVLLATKTNYRHNPFLPAILISGVALNNGQQAAGRVQFISNGNVLATVPLTHGLALTVLSRSLPRGTYKIIARFVPTDAANIAGVDGNEVDIQIT